MGTVVVLHGGILSECWRRSAAAASNTVSLDELGGLDDGYRYTVRSRANPLRC